MINVSDTAHAGTKMDAHASGERTFSQLGLLRLHRLIVSGAVRDELVRELRRLCDGGIRLRAQRFQLLLNGRGRITGCVARRYRRCPVRVCARRLLLGELCEVHLSLHDAHRRVHSRLEVGELRARHLLDADAGCVEAELRRHLLLLAHHLLLLLHVHALAVQQLLVLRRELAQQRLELTNARRLRRELLLDAEGGRLRRGWLDRRER